MTETEIKQLSRERALDWRQAGVETGRVEAYESVAKSFDIAAESGEVSDYDQAWNESYALRAAALDGWAEGVSNETEIDILTKRFGLFIDNYSAAHYRRFER